MKKYPLFVIFFSICLSFVTSAKEKADSLAEIYGNVRGTYSVFGYGSYEVEDYLSNVNVMLTFQNESKRDTAYTMTDRRGSFHFQENRAPDNRPYTFTCREKDHYRKIYDRSRT